MSTLIHKKTGFVLAKEVIRAEGLFLRLKGLLGTKDFSLSHVLWIIPCSGIHTFFMKFSIDIIFVTRNLKITRVLRGIPPWRFVSSPLFSRSHSVFEFKAGVLDRYVLEPGDQLDVGH